MKPLLQEIVHVLKSRTIITLLVMYGFNLLAAFGMKISQNEYILCNALLTTFAAYFRISTKQTYK